MVRAYQIAAGAVFASAALHFAALAGAAFLPYALPLLAVTLFYLGVGWGLMHRLRWLAYVTFICMLIGAIGALFEVGRGRFGDVWMLLIIAADVVAAAALFVVIWRTVPTDVSA